MRLGVNGARLAGRRLGVGRYLEYLLQYWPECESAFSDIPVYVPRPPDDLMVLDPVRFETLRPPSSSALWEHWTLPRAKGPDDLFFCPGYTVPLGGGGRPTVVTHHGSYEAIPEAFPFWERTRARLLYRYGCRRADLVITVSESSKRDIQRYYGVAESRIRVIPVGVDDAFRPLDDRAGALRRRREFFPDGRPFLLFVGKLSRRRNIPALVASLGRLRAAGHRHGLVLIGPDPVGQRPLVLARKHGVEGDVVHREYASHGELIETYNAADCVIYPSSYEGFGLPVLEGMACGRPVVTLANSAFPEFAGGIAQFARDATPEALAAAVATVLDGPELRERARRDGPLRAAEYRWKGIAQRTIDLLGEVARAGGVPSAAPR